ncbi:armadillo-type protein [Radiomyces spectabilis]|uniref:armadillo-type protein n=1 Tax=Radiomyces spectabilis TaxID=64574 RepID=UPI0022206FF8|nr:armadillo-type protein [Radiomyces spectabilis]KAI8377492.1 armadillo-type protein [Radiomyces spectabilis]
MDDKVELRRANRLAWQKEGTVLTRAIADDAQFKNLDSNIKKNTAFIKKCKTSLAADVKQQLLNDIKKLSLEKFISELATSVMEGMLKCKTTVDVAACIEVLSALHQRFPNTFTRLLTYNMAKILQPPSKQHLASLTQEQREKEEQSRVFRQRTYLRIAVELWLVGVLRKVEDGIPSLASASLEGVETQRDGVAGLGGSSSTDALKEKKKEEKENDRATTQGGFVFRVLKDLYMPFEQLASDIEQHVNLPLAVSFLKNFGQPVLGIVPRKNQAAAAQHKEEAEGAGADSTSLAAEESAEPVPLTADSAITPEQRELFKNLLMAYYRSLEKHLVKEHKYIKNIDCRNREILFTRGELSEESKQKYEKTTKLYEKLLNNTQTLADALNMEMPELPEDEGVTKVSMVTAGPSNTFAEGKTTVFTIVYAFDNPQESTGNGIWEDDYARKFYEDLPDLRILVPGVFLDSENQRKAEEKEGEAENAEKEETPADVTTESPDAAAAKEDEADTMPNDAPVDDDSADADDETLLENDADINVDPSAIVDEALDADKDDSADNAANVKPTQLAQLDALLARLPTLGNRDLIDSAAVEFCYLNSKAARKRLIKAVLSVPRQRVDLLPYYSRLIAILNQYYPDVGDTVLAALTHEFKGLQRKKTADLLETRVKNIRFLAELTKFRVTPAHTIFHIFKVALDDFTNQNIDVVCNLLETCGRFLLKAPETGVRMGNMLEIVMRKKNVQHLDNRQALMVENAYYQANPPDRSAVVEKHRSTMELYLRKLIYTDLNKKSLDRILKQLRKLHWEDPEVVHLLSKLFHKIWKIKYSNIHLMAILASGLNRYHSDFGMKVVDGVVEEIRVGLEQNIFKHNQRRIAVVKYLGELYNYRMVDSPLIFDTLYTIVTFGHDFGRPARERPCPIDAPHDFFRTRLCCTLLDTCGMCFDRGSAKRKLNQFLVFFQMYILSKMKPPMDVDFMVTDTFEMLRPQMHIFASYEEANEEVDRMLLEQLKAVQGADGKAQEEGFEDSESESSSDEGEDEDEDVEKDEEEEEDEENDSAMANNDGEEDDVVVLKKKEEQISKEEDEEFEREFSKMMAESIESRKFEKKTAVLDVPIPMNLRGLQDRRSAAQEKGKANDGKMAFTLLTRKGNRQQTKIMEVPADSLLAVTTRSKQEAEREEQQHLKQLVLNYEEREEAAARQAALEERARQRGQWRGRRILHMGGGGGQAYSSSPRR